MVRVPQELCCCHAQAGCRRGGVELSGGPEQRLCDLQLRFRAVLLFSLLRAASGTSDVLVHLSLTF